LKTYRTQLHGHIIEARQGDLGCDRVLIDGKVVSTKYLGGWYGASHFVEIEDEAGKVRHVEISWIDRSRLKVGKYRMCLTVDGVVRGEIEPTDPGLAPGSCTHCGYSLEGLNAENQEIRCPECGRHTSAALIDTPTRSDS
jgi:hypothetical protein